MKKSYKKLSGLLILIMIAQAVPAWAFPSMAEAGAEVEMEAESEALYTEDMMAESEADGAVLYSGKCGPSANWTLRDNGLFEVTGSGYMYNYIVYGVDSWLSNYVLRKPWANVQDDYLPFEYLENDEVYYEYGEEYPEWDDYVDDIKKIEISEGILSVGMGCFCECDNLKEVKLPRSLKYLRDMAFSDCEALEEVNIPEDLSSIGPSCFYSCTSLRSVTLPDGLKAIGKEAFYDCDSLLSMVIPAGIEYIGSGVFSYCDSLTAVIFEDGVEKPGEAMFADGNVKYIYLPASITMVASVFRGMTYEYVLYGGTEVDMEKLRKTNGESIFKKSKELRYNAARPQLAYVTLDAGDGYLDGEKKIASMEYAGFIGCPLITLESEPERKDYFPDYWYRDGDESAVTDIGSLILDGDISLSIKWREPYKLTLTCYYREGEVYRTVNVTEGKKPSKPKNPTLKGLVFKGWYTDKKLTKAFNFNEPLYESLSLYAAWLPFDLAGHHSIILYGENNTPLTVTFDYTDRVIYDGRKHVWTGSGAVSDNKTSPDIRIENFSISYDGVPLTGITIAKVVCKNNLRATRYSDRLGDYQYMTFGIKLKYDKNDPVVTALTKRYKAFKKVLKRALNPRMHTYRDDGETQHEWDFDPLEVDIQPIEVSSNTALYTRAEYEADPGLKNADGVFIYDGEEKCKWKTAVEYGKLTTYVVKADVRGLYYQKLVQTAAGPVPVQFALKAGSWKLKRKYDREYGDHTYEWLLRPANADYYDSGMKPGDKFLKLHANGGIINGDLPPIPRQEEDIAKDPAGTT